ncbi:uncharacterized protein tex15 [Mustelus asterias]
MVTSKTNQDPRLLKRSNGVEDGNDCSIPKPVPLPVEPLYSIDSLMKTLCFLRSCSATPAWQLCASEAGSQAADATAQEQARLQNATAEQGDLAPVVTAGPGGGLRSTPAISTVVSPAANHQEQKKTNQDSDLTVLTRLDVKVDSGVQISKVPSKSSTGEHSNGPFFEDIKLYESEVKKKLQKYSSYLVLCDKERLSKIQSLKRLSRTDRKAFFCRLKKYDKYYERYQHELGLGKCCSAIVSRSHDVSHPYTSSGSAGGATQPCSCVLTHGGGSAGCSTEPAFSAAAACLSESKGHEQIETTLSNSKGMNDKLVGGVQSFTAAPDNQLCDLSCAASEILHSAEGVTTKRFDPAEEIAPETGSAVGEWNRELQSSLDNKEMSMVEATPLATQSQRQVNSPSIISNQHVRVSDESTPLNFLSPVDLQNVEIAYGHEVPTAMEICKGSRIVGLNEEVVASEDTQSWLENGEFSEDRLFSNFQLEEVTSSEYTDEGHDEPPNVDPLLDFLAARIEWENLFERTKENEPRAGPELATIPQNFDRQIPPPTKTKSGQLTWTPQGSASIHAKLPTPGSHTAIPNLQVTLSSDYIAEFNQHPSLTELLVWNGDCLGYSGKCRAKLRNSAETETGGTLQTMREDQEGVLVRETNKLAPTAEHLESALQRGSKELSQVWAGTNNDACGLISKNHTLNKVSSNPHPQLTINCTREDRFCALPLNKQLPGGEQSGVLQSPKSRTHKAETTHVTLLTNIQSNKKIMASDNTEAGLLNESHGTPGIHTGKLMSHTKSKGEHPSALSDNLCEKTVLKNESRKKSTLRPQNKDMKPHCKKISDSKENSKVTSNRSVRHVDSDPDRNKVNKPEDNNDKFLRNWQHNVTKKGSSVRLAGEPRDTLGPDNNVRSLLQAQGFPNHKALALVHTGRSARHVPYVGIRTTEGFKEKVQVSDLASSYERCIGAFINCKRQIAQVASVLSSEASLSKSSRLSKLLTKAVANLNKAYKRVGKSSEIVKRTGVRVSQSSQPKPCQSNCSTSWESCDVHAHKRHWHRSGRETAPKGSKFNMQMLAVPQQRCERLCQGVPRTDYKRESNKKEQATRVQHSPRMAKEPTSIMSSAEASTNSVRFQSAVTKFHPRCVILRRDCAQILHSNPNSSQEFGSGEANPPVQRSEWTEPPAVASQTGSTLVERHLVNAEEMELPAEPRPWESPTSSRLEEYRMHVDPQEGGLLLGEEPGLEMTLESGFDSQMSDKPQKVKLPLASQRVGSPGVRLEPSSELQSQLENGLPQSRGESRAGQWWVKDRNRPRLGVLSPGQIQELDPPAPLRVTEPFLKPRGLHPPLPRGLSWETSSLDTKLEALDQSVKMECPLQTFPAGSRTEEWTKLDHRTDAAVTLQTLSSGPAVGCTITEFQVNNPKHKSQMESGAESGTGSHMASRGSVGTKLGSADPLGVAAAPVPHRRAQQAANLDTRLQSLPGGAQHRASTVKCPRGGGSATEPKKKDSPSVEREEGEIFSNNEFALLGRRQGLGQEAERVEGVCPARIARETCPAQSKKATQSPGGRVAKISEILYQADSTSSLDSLQKLKLSCEEMLPLFISSFELWQGDSFAESLLCRDWFVRNSSGQSCLRPASLKPEALHPYVELQMVMEAAQFLDNKISFLRGLPTFRSLLWYDETLYGDLLCEKVGYQQQSVLYPSFQERVQNNCLEVLSDYRAQVLKSCQTERQGGNAYYVYLKHRRELEECSAVMRSISDCCYFCLSVPLTSSVNYGDDVESLEALRKHVWALINDHSSLPDSQRDAAKLLHLWIIADFVNAKTRTIHSCPGVNGGQLWWFGLEHLQFSAAKALAWEKRVERKELSKSWTPVGEDNSQQQKTRELMVELNKEALSLMYNRHNSLAPGEITPCTEERPDRAHRHDQLLGTSGTAALRTADGELLGQPTAGLGDPDGKCPRLLSDQFGSVGKILERSRAAQREELEQLLAKCENQLGSLMKLFQVLQEVEADKVLLTEASFPARFSARDTSPVLLNPDAVEIYIELVMVYETVHYLRNLMAHQLNEATYRGMLWFDPALLPELLHNQQDTSIFSIFREKYLHDPAEALERAISTLQQELDLIFEYRQSTNYTYAVQLLSRELSEIMAVKKYTQQHNVGVKMYVNAVPCAASINYGYTESDLTHNYRQLVQVLEKLVKAPMKDLGKMAHIMEAMKSIMDMRQVAAKSSYSTLQVLTYQMRQNSKKRKLLEESKSVQTSPKVGNSPECARLEWSIRADVIAGYKTHAAQLANLRKRRLCDPPLFQNPEDDEADDRPANKQKMVTGNNLKSPEC